MMSVIVSLLMACVLNVVKANMYYFSHSPTSIPGDYGVYSYDSDSQELKSLATGKESSYTAWAMVSGAATCGGRYYASAVDVPIDAAILITELDTGKTQIFDWTNFGSGSDNLHNMYCDPSDKSGQTLFVVSNVIGSSGYEFSLSKMKIDSDYKFTMDKIADFPLPRKAVPTAYDTAFQMSPDIKTMYGMWTNQQGEVGWIQTMDTATGNVTTYSLGADSNVPYSLLVDTAGDMMLVTYQNTEDGTEYTKCKLTLSGGNAKQTDCDVDNSLYTSGQPWTIQMSDGQFYAMARNVGSGSGQGIVTITADGTIVDTLSMDDVFKGKDLPAQGTFGGLSVVVPGASSRGNGKSKMDARKAQCQRKCGHDMTCLTICYGANFAPGKLAPVVPTLHPAIGRNGFIYSSDEQRKCATKCSDDSEGLNEVLVRDCYHKCTR